MTSELQISKRAAIMPASPIRKLVPLGEAAKARGVHVHHLNIGQPDIETPPEFLEAVRAFREKIVSYGNSQGLKIFIDSLVRYYGGLDIPLTQRNVMVTTGGSEAITFAMTAVAEPGDEIIVFEPFYTNYNGFAIMGGVKLLPLPTMPEDGYRLPPEDVIDAAVTPKTRAIMICNPNNPTGTALSADELDTIRRIALRRGLFVLSDEVYREFIYEGSTLSVLQLEGLEQHAIVLDSLSKRYSLCGGRMGCIVSRNEKLMDVFVRFGQARLCAATLEQIGSAALVDEGSKYFAPMISEYRARRDATYEELMRIPGVVCRKPSGAFYIMARLPVDDADAFAAWMLSEFSHENETTMIAPGSGFYATPGRGRDEARLAYVLNEHDCRSAVRILGRGVEAYNKSRGA